MFLTAYVRKVAFYGPALSLVATMAFANPIPAGEGIEKIKALAGTWIEVDGNEMGILTYELTANGTAVVELMGGMTTIYHQDHSSLVATHYCSMGNQPRMRAGEAEITSESIAFDFADITNHRPGRGHINSVKLIFVSPNELIQEWTYKSDDEVGPPFSIRFQRVEAYRVTTEQLTEQKIVGMRKTTTFPDLEGVLKSTLSHIKDYADSADLAVTGFPVTRYEVFSDTEIVVFVGLPYTGEVITEGEILTSVLEAGPSATVVHTGSSETSFAAYESLHGWMARNQRRANGAPWEVLLTDIATTVPERRLTKIVYPITD